MLGAKQMAVVGDCVDSDLPPAGLMVQPEVLEASPLCNKDPPSKNQQRVRYVYMIVIQVGLNIR
jgi:hypothetical protein